MPVDEAGVSNSLHPSPDTAVRKAYGSRSFRVMAGVKVVVRSRVKVSCNVQLPGSCTQENRSFVSRRGCEPEVRCYGKAGVVAIFSSKSQLRFRWSSKSSKAESRETANAELGLRSKSRSGVLLELRG